MTRIRLTPFILFFLWACMFTTAGATDAAADSAGTGRAALGDYLAGPPSAEEKERLAAVLRIFHDANATNRPAAYTGKRTGFISPGEVYLRAVKKNIALQSGELDAEIAAAAVQQAEAVFDPVLNLSFTYSETDTNKRSKEIYLQTKKFYPPAEIAIPTNPFNSEAQIVAIGWRQQNEGIRELKTVTASKEPDNGPTNTFDYTLGISQKLPWGPEVNLGLSFQDRDVYYDTHGHSYHKPWAASFVADMTTPLPFTKGFGPYSPDDTAVKLSKKQKEIGALNVQTALNDILYAADLAYWNVVRRFENLLVLNQRRKLLEQRLQSVLRRYENREATTYDRLQVESALDESMALETDAIQALFTASFDLAGLIEDDAEQQAEFLYLPYRYLASVNSTESPDLADALDRAVSGRPELQTARTRMEEARINLDYSENQLRPDLSASGGYSGKQDAAVHGYADPIAALDTMNHVDTESYYGAVAYRYPILNRELDARFEQAKLDVRLAGLNHRTTRNTVVRETNDAAALVRTSISRITAAEESARFAELAYDKVLLRQEYGGVSEFEVLQALQRLSEARLALVLARIDHRTALTALSAATGELAEDAADRAANGELDRHRLEVLREGNAVHLFSSKEPDEEIKK